MPSFGDTALIALIALLLFGPKKLPELARQLGKLMGEFRRASNEFRMQMEDELRIAEQTDRQKEIAAMQAAAPVAPLLEDESIVTEHPYEPIVSGTENTIAAPEAQEAEKTDGPLPIASSGELDMMPPATGLPMSRTASSSPLAPVIESIPQAAEHNADEASVHG